MVFENSKLEFKYNILNYIAFIPSCAGTSYLPSPPQEEYVTEAEIFIDVNATLCPGATYFRVIENKIYMATDGAVVCEAVSNGNDPSVIVVNGQVDFKPSANVKLIADKITLHPGGGSINAHYNTNLCIGNSTGCL